MLRVLLTLGLGLAVAAVAGAQGTVVRPDVVAPGTVAGARGETERMAATVMRIWPAGVVLTTKKPGEWGYEEGVLLDGMLAEWRVTHDPTEFAYVQAAVDKYVRADGSIQMDRQGRAYPVDAHTLDDIELGRAVLDVYRQTHAERYAKAARFLHEQLRTQPRNASGGYWHKQIYPNQMWLDGAYMAEPFRADFEVAFHDDADWADIAKQFVLMDEHMRDPASGLLRHGWDESKRMPWADPKTGLSPTVWARAMGWYCMALVDVLEVFPKGRPEREQLLEVLRRTLSTVGEYQDQASGLWWQVMNRGPEVTGTLDAHGKMQMHQDRPAEAGNFVEASASAMFSYALAKSVRLGFVFPAYDEDAAEAWRGLQARFVHETDGGMVLTGTVKAAGLGGTPYRSGTYDYYVHEPTGENDAKGVGAYLLAGSEMERMGAALEATRKGLPAGDGWKPVMPKLD